VRKRLEGMPGYRKILAAGVFRIDPGDGSGGPSQGYRAQPDNAQAGPHPAPDRAADGWLVPVSLNIGPGA
jgi:hypothetical protein